MSSDADPSANPKMKPIDSPLLLGIDCATKVASVALARGERVCAVRTARSGSHHGESLLVEIDALLTEEQVALSDLEAFAITVGPGAFTSLRIGIATVKGLAFASTLEVASVSTLACVAHAAFASGSGFVRCAAVLDARRGAVYAAEYEIAEPHGEPALSGALPEGVYAAAELAKRLSRGARLAGELPRELVGALRAAGRDDLQLAEAAGGESLPRAASVACLGARMLARGEGQSAARLAARYLLRPEAEEQRLGAARSLDTLGKLQ